VTIYASLGLVFFYATVWPMNDKVNNLMQLCNELFLLTCVHLMFAFTDYTVDPFKRFQIGFAYLIFIATNFTVNIALIAHTLVKKVQKAYRDWKNKDNSAKKTKNKEQTKKSQLKLSKRRKEVGERLYYDDEIPQPVGELLENKSESRVDEESKESSIS